MELAEGKRSKAETLQAQTLLWNHIFHQIDSMSLKCAVELGIPDAIHRHGKPITLSDLLSALNIPPAKAAELRRLMRLLTHSGIFTRLSAANDEEDQEHVYYSLTPVSGLLVNDNNNSKGGTNGCTGTSLSAFVLAMTHHRLMDPFQSLSAWFKGQGPSPFFVQHGCGIWDMKDRDPGFNELFDYAMESDTGFLMPALLQECRHVFDGVGSLVDVGGGTGSAALAITEAFPGIKCTVLELPPVVKAAKDLQRSISGSVEFVVGDMFEYIPPADAVFLKWILHDWPDEECVKILKRCKEAILSGRNGGKIIIVDLVIREDDTDSRTIEAQLYMDMLMMALYPGAEREEPELRKIFTDAGFGHYKITPGLGVRSVIELFP